VDEMSSALPRLYISTLKNAGLDEFGNGLELDFQPQGKFRTIAGKKCELFLTSERQLMFFWIPEKPLLNPIFDIKNWIEKQPAHDFQDVIFFGVADKPMPMVVMGTYITSYKPGKVKPPVLDLTNYGIRDERLQDRRDEERQLDEIDVRTIDIGNEGMIDAVQEGEYMPTETIVVEEAPTGIKGYDDVVPPPVQEGRWEDIAPQRTVPEAPPAPVKEVPNDFPLPATPADPSLLIPEELRTYLDHPTNRFMGSAFFTLRWKRGVNVKVWDVQYYATADRSVLISKGHEPLPNTRTCALVIDRKAGTEKAYSLDLDSTVFIFDRTLRTAYTSPLEPFMVDKPAGNVKNLLGRDCTQRRFQNETYLRDAWMDKTVPSIFLDLFSARKTWDGLDETIYGSRLGIADRAMPLEVDLHWPEGNITMRVISVTQGPIDTGMFNVTKEMFRR